MDDGKPLPPGFRPELVLRPVIRELTRTQVCFPDLKLLVDRISTVTLPVNERSVKNEAFRLFLTDGDRTIQAVLKRKCHSHVTSLDVREGSYVILRAYRLARGRRLSGNGSVIYIIIEDLYSIGEEPRDNVDEERHDRYIELIKTPQRQSTKTIDEDERYGSSRRRILNLPGDRQQKKHQGDGDDPFSLTITPNILQGSNSKTKEISPNGSSKELTGSTIKFSSSEQKKRRREEPFDEIDPNLTPRIVKVTKLAEEMFASKNKAIDRAGTHDALSRLESQPPAIAKHTDVAHENPVDQTYIAPKPKPETAKKADQTAETNRVAGGFRAFTADNPMSPSPSSVLRQPLGNSKSLLPIKRPLRIRSLDSLTGSNATRNKVHDIFAVICSVDESVIKPAAMPLKRDIRIMDRSTDKKVLVSVFVDPVSFKPAVGTVALFRSLTTHEWDRGMLNVYPQQCAGREWFVEDPIGVEGCDVVGLRRWWRKKMDAELERQSQMQDR